MRAPGSGTTVSWPAQVGLRVELTQPLGQLFVQADPGAVQYHLTRIYAKPGVRSRAELGAARR